MSKIGKKDLFNLIIASIALIVSIISFWFSYYSYCDTKQEKISISAHPVNSNYQTKLYLLGTNVIIPAYWSIMLTNNSEKTISITDITVENIRQDKSQILYSHLYDGVLENIEKFDENKIEMPLNISSGESKKMYIRIGIFCEEKASDCLRVGFDLWSEPNSKNGKWIRLNQAQIKLAKEKYIDFYDNTSKIESENENILSFESDAKKQQLFRISFITGKNKMFSKDIKLYMIKE